MQTEFFYFFGGGCRQFKFISFEKQLFCFAYYYFFRTSSTILYIIYIKTSVLFYRISWNVFSLLFVITLWFELQKWNPPKNLKHFVRLFSIKHYCHTLFRSNTFFWGKNTEALKIEVLTNIKTFLSAMFSISFMLICFLFHLCLFVFYVIYANRFPFLFKIRNNQTFNKLSDQHIL